MKVTTCTAPVNIAVIKYWGKRDEDLILPINDSISVTLSSDQMHAKTTVAVSPTFLSDRIWLNGKEESMDNPRLINCLREIRLRATKNKADADDADFHQWKVHICSENNFPTAAGLASSAAGYACLVSALCNLFNVEGDDISVFARQGSGSACRSIYGGFVQWEMGSRPDGSDSVARQLHPAQHWEDMRVLILVANDSQKKVPSSVGMKLSVKTSELLQQRVKIVPGRIQQMKQAISERDFAKFCEITMKDSNQFHAICLDTFPPCVYMNATSYSVIDMVHQVNKVAGKYLACYTFDAGPNACLYLMKEHVPLFVGLIKHFFPEDRSGQDFIQGAPMERNPAEVQNSINEYVSQISLPAIKGGLHYVIHTSVGQGPAVLGKADHLLSDEGLPIRI